MKPRSTIQRKLVTAIMLTSTTVIVLVGVVLTAHEVVSFRHWMVQVLTTRARMVAANSTAALAFDNMDDARLVLDALRSDPNTTAAALYDREGRVFATYSATATHPILPAVPRRSGYAFERSHLIVFEPVIHDGMWLGTLYMQSDLRVLESRLQLFLLVVLVAIAGSTAVAFALSTWLKRRIAQPVLSLAAAAQRVSERQDYSVRAVAETDDELGLLADSFNDMLGQIQLRDSALQASEARYRQLNAELEQRVAARTGELAAANKELEAFSYSVSHDLRAPLRAVDGFSKALLDEYGPRLEDKARDYLGRMRGAARHMGQLIDDLLNLARLSRADLHRQPVNLTALAKDIAGSLTQSQPERRVRFDIAEGLTTEGDTQLLSVVLDNLLRNAWKFTSRHEAGRIELGRKQDNGVPAYFVRDDGTGFDMAHAKLLFTPFQRLHRQSDFEGTGIGLATVQRIIQRHRGRLWAEGVVEGGATFYFTLWEREQS